MYLDCAKAFDKFPHGRLMEKLEKHGIGGKVFNWIREWFSGRSQRVSVNGYYSTWQSMTSGVPQGLMLGPITFLIFISDHESGLVNLVFIFADDTKFLGKVNSAYERDLLQIATTLTATDGLVEDMANAVQHLQVQSYAFWSW